jgi:hypothetical protein
MSGELYYDRDVSMLMGRERHARVVALGRHHHDDRGRRWWSWDELLECEGIIDFEDGIEEEDGRDDTPDHPP